MDKLSTLTSPLGSRNEELLEAKKILQEDNEVCFVRKQFSISFLEFTSKRPYQKRAIFTEKYKKIGKIFKT